MKKPNYWHEPDWSYHCDCAGQPSWTWHYHGNHSVQSASLKQLQCPRQHVSCGTSQKSSEEATSLRSLMEDEFADQLGASHTNHGLIGDLRNPCAAWITPLLATNHLGRFSKRGGKHAGSPSLSPRKPATAGSMAVESCSRSCRIFHGNESLGYRIAMPPNHALEQIEFGNAEPVGSLFMRLYD